MKKSLIFSSIILFISAILYLKIHKINSQTIDLQIVHKSILNNNEKEPNFEISILKKTLSQRDTLKYNICNTFEESISLLQSELIKVDTIQSNRETKDYIKSLIIADYVYAAFSFQFLGSKLGMAKDASSIKNWDKIAIKTCFNLGNKNQYAVFCGERTTFYNRLIEKLLKLKTKQASVEGVHTFPIIIIGGKDYIIDPYDPFVAVDTLSKTVLDYDLIVKKQYKSLQPIRTKRMFGSSRMLISRKLYTRLKNVYGKISLANMLDKYLIENDQYLSPFKPKNYEPPLEKTKKITTILNNKNIFAVNINGRIDGNLISEKDFYKYYIESRY
ncbi:hypothetical protein [Flavobacterium sp. 123]|jgi:hypothetical protein|uniref:hypothetical protein n=1 Tax=Flavobacterium sp. 123 TaxID=2135627 RepID=UPI000EAB6744|nr:hypothetical protein [Flavobacterium sp. 123]RKS99665.1 hypothetical protein C8C88_1460 [Flavobacterium sp. 123]